MAEFSNIAKLPPSNLKLETEAPELKVKIIPAKGDHEKPLRGKRKPKKIISFYKCEIISKSETQSRKKEYFKRRGSASSDKNRHILGKKGSHYLRFQLWNEIDPIFFFYQNLNLNQDHQV